MNHLSVFADFLEVILNVKDFSLFLGTIIMMLLKKRFKM